MVRAAQSAASARAFRARYVAWVDVHLHYFFFQAEDGIRDLTVTGVQTCALPISSCTNAHTSPLAPCCLARSVSASSSERGISRGPALIPRTTPPDSSAPLNTLNSEIGRASCRERV